MEKGMSSGEGLPSRAPQASAAKVTVKESETRQPCEEKRGGFVLVHAGETLWVSWSGNQKCFPFLAVKNTKDCISHLTKRVGTKEPVSCYSVSWLEYFTMVLLPTSSLFSLSYLPYIIRMFGSVVLKPK